MNLIQKIESYIDKDPDNDWKFGKNFGLMLAAQAVKNEIEQQPGYDLINRQAAIDAMATTLWHYPNECYRNLNEYEFAKGVAELGLKSVPSAQPERKQGQWIEVKGNLWSGFECDQCGKKSDYKERYCAHCGTSMKGKEK